MPLRNRCFWMMLAAMVGLAAMGKLSRSNDHVLQADTMPQGAALAVGGPAWFPASESTFLFPVQSKDPEGLGAGKLLVASRNLGDPNFARTVILLVRYDEQGVLGLILNRRTEVPLSRVLKDFKAAKDRSDRVYLGGPVEMPDVFALLRSPSKVENADQIFGGVYFISAKSVFEQTISTRPDPAKFHVYLGYAGWAQEQLRKEVELGAWFIFPADANTVFDADPDSLWSRTIRKTELNFAGSGLGGRGSYLHCENSLMPRGSRSLGRSGVGPRTSGGSLLRRRQGWCRLSSGSSDGWRRRQNGIGTELGKAGADRYTRSAWTAGGCPHIAIAAA